MRDYWVVFVSDGMASTVQEAHDATLFTMGRHFATVATGEQVLAAWGLPEDQAAPPRRVPL